MRPWARLLFAILLGLGGLAREAEACSCMQSGPACQAFWNAEAVFDATVQGIEPVTRDEVIGERTLKITDRLVRLEVGAAYKGVNTGPIAVRTASDGAACGYDFKVGRRYLVFASKSRIDGGWTVSLCSATQPIDKAGDTEEFLASLSQPARGGRIFGLIRGTYDPLAPQRPEGENRIDATLRLTGGAREQTSASKNGSFEFTGLTAGPYRLEIVLPKGFTTYEESRFIDLPNERACRQEDFGVSHAGRITGVVQTAQGRPAKVTIEVTRPDARPTREYGLLTRTGDWQNDGAFQVTGLAPGQYIVGVNLGDLPNRATPYPRTVYPADGTGDAVITLGLGDTYDIGIWRLPPPLAMVKVSGLASWADGSPAAGAHIGAWDVTGDPVDPARGAGMTTAASDGSFTLELLQSRTYTFMARDRSNALLRVQGPRLRIGPVMLDPVRLTLTPTRNPPNP